MLEDNFFLIPIDDSFLKEALAQIICEDFCLAEEYALHLVEERVMPHLSRLVGHTKLVIERNYVDKVYRDSYYSYYASKRTHYGRDAIKISFFNDENNKITSLDVFKDKNHITFLKENYRGFVVLRPTSPYIVGRSAIAPNLLKDNSFKTCVAAIPSTAMGIKFNVQAFPFASQDTETISCAETMIWALMEYYGNKYPEYSPVLPSRILQLLKQNTVERQLPSAGLSVESMSYLLKEFGFGPKLYSRDVFGEDFESLLSCYIESGIPVIVALQNENAHNRIPPEKFKFIGHAVLCIGHEKVNAKRIQSLSGKEFETTAKNTLKIKDWDEVDKKFLFIDDNFPVYQSEKLGTPTGRYANLGDANWNSCEISHFIVPLYRKIYLEAYVAKNFVKELLCSDFFYFANGKELYLRTFLCSTRSYREYVMLGNMNDELKRIIMNKSLPRFIWITEISDDLGILRNQANGLILLDATEANKLDYRSLIFAAYDQKVIQYDKDKRTIGDSPLQNTPFTIFDRNLKN